ncbi:unnamed protein product [Coffea canephora]|uniref:Uncharacterized protein n=1 Tax=Coffea canephora TaxID=49390 RepID=A0A068UG47_COFCA|nr:unnamed protein product [Coffea canephora]
MWLVRTYLNCMSCFWGCNQEAILRFDVWLSYSTVISEVNVILEIDLFWENRCCNRLGYTSEGFLLACLRESWRELGRRPANPLVRLRGKWGRHNECYDSSFHYE